MGIRAAKFMGIKGSKIVKDIFEPARPASRCRMQGLVLRKVGNPFCFHKMPNLHPRADKESSLQARTAWV